MYKPIINYENLYMIGDDGSVKSLPKQFINNKGYLCTTKEKILKPQIRNNYLFVRLSKNNIKETFSVHRLVALHFIDNPDNKPYVNHIDGNRKNNNVLNLEWVSSNENMQHSYYVLEKNKKNVKCITTNKIYSSIREASRQTNRPTAQICRSCKSHKEIKGLLWEYIN